MGLKTNKIHKVYKTLIDMIDTGRMKCGFTQNDFDAACNCIMELQKCARSETSNEMVAIFYKDQGFIVTSKDTIFEIILK